ncbi:unnamed protein product [Paramecium sonneborni]|uniref:MORN repeat protein n=1 Tax=Paramecium sonneborni TaxID=65129 RepID=A0A8S1R3U0_9CILI|nr:unnamed protein product [Paramecium sonneborni]
MAIVEAAIQTEGTGRFEYQDGTVYEGQWKLIEGKKVKHGKGRIVIASSLSTDNDLKEEYNGEFENDQMCGEGVYIYKSGAIYRGQFRDNRHNGIGFYQFPEGCTYEGEWVNHKMHGEGVFIDKEGNRWEGEFVEGIYQSKMQKQLKMEKMLNKKETDIRENASHFFNRFLDAYAHSDKKTMKDNMTPFFATTEDIKLYVKEPYPQFPDRPPEKWEAAIKFLQVGSLNIPRSNTAAKILDPQNILAAQFSGVGQVAEVIVQDNTRIVRLAICNTAEDKWVIVFYHDNEEQEVKKKK